jgi:hypothetical protein
MKLGAMYRAAVDKGMREDARSAEELQQVLTRARTEYDKLDEADKEFFDRERSRTPTRTRGSARAIRIKRFAASSWVSTWRSGRCFSPTGCVRRARRSI